MKKVFILTGESSGEMYGALLTRALKNKWDDMRIAGVGGERMKREGVDLISEISGAFGLVELVSKLRTLKKTFNNVVHFILTEKPDVLVLIDFPDFNIKVAKAVRHSGVKMLYYVSPQVWAWRRKRVHIISELSDHVAVILPFEEDYYKDKGVTCEFVGHPTIEEIESVKGEKSHIKKSLGLDGDAPVLAMLPGSRDSEMKRLLPVLTEVVDLFSKEFPEYRYIMPVALNVDRSKYDNHFDRLKNKRVHLVDGEAVKVLSCSDLAVVASGTAAFQAALIGVPIVVIYKLFPLTYWLGKIIINVKYINLVNIMCDEEVIKEMLQGRANPAAIYSELKKIAEDSNYRKQMLDRFGKIRGLFDNKQASGRVSDIIGELGSWS